jgi:hypothetical protein
VYIEHSKKKKKKKRKEFKSSSLEEDFDIDNGPDLAQGSEDDGETDAEELSLERESVAWDDDVEVVGTADDSENPAANHLEAIRRIRSYFRQHGTDDDAAGQFSEVFGQSWPPLPSIAQKNQRLRRWAGKVRTFLVNVAAETVSQRESAKQSSLEEAVALFQCAVNQYTPRYVLQELARTVEKRYVTACLGQGSLDDWSPPEDDFDEDGKDAFQHVARQFHAAHPNVSDEANLVLITGFGWFPVAAYRRRMSRKRAREIVWQPSFEQTMQGADGMHTALPDRASWDPYLSED